MKTNFSGVKQKLMGLMIGSLISVSAFAQSATQARVSELSAWTNPIFISLLAIILLLLIVIIVLGDVLKGTAKYNTDKLKNTIGKYFGVVVFVSLLSGNVFAQSTTTAVETNYFSEMNSVLFYVMVFIILFEVLIIAMLLNSIKLLLGIEESKAAERAIAGEVETPVDALLDKLNASVSLEEEGTIMLDHNYDGIRELDNNLPPWWKYGFYITIVWAFGYLIYFHFTYNGMSSEQEYKAEVSKAEADLAEYMKNSANLVDETNVKLLSDASSLETGKQMFFDNCAVCHKADGGGNVGPNLTDDYWLHGGSVKDVFKTIKYGYTDKGMKSWKDDLSPSQIAMITSYVKTLHGTDPAGAKEKQGDLYKEETTVADSTVVLSDTLKTPVDSSATKK